MGFLNTGRFVAPSLPPGAYEVVVEAPGFKKARRSGIELQVNLAAASESDSGLLGVPVRGCGSGIQSADQ